jgi:hypothetical protein
MLQVLVYTNREVGLRQAKRWFVVPIEIYFRDFMLDWKIERQRVVVDDTVTAVVEITWYTCTVNNKKNLINSITNELSGFKLMQVLFDNAS